MLDSVVKMTTVLEECMSEEQRSVARFFFVCGQKDSVQRIFIKDMFPVYGGKCLLRRKAVHSWVDKLPH
jgi:hypothetical protein